MATLNPGETIEEYFQHLDEELRNPTEAVAKELLGVKSLVMVFVLRGVHGGTWTIDVENGIGRAVKRRPGMDGTGNRKVDCRLESSVKTLMSIARGQTKPLTAFIKRDIKFSGDRNSFKAIQTALQNAGEKMAPQLEAIKSVVAPNVAIPGFDGMSNGTALNNASVATPAVGFGTIFIESSNPRWMKDGESSTCACCSARFGLLNRRHHCRLCGKLVCGTCSDNALAGERVCDFCLQEQMSKGSAPPPTPPAQRTNPTSMNGQSPMDSFGEATPTSSSFTTPPRSGRRPSAPAAFSSSKQVNFGNSPGAAAAATAIPKVPQVPESTLLPFGKLRSQMDKEQRVPIDMSVTDPGEHSVLNFARVAMGKIRALENKVRDLAPLSLRNWLLKNAFNIGPRVVVGLPLVLSWYTVIRTASRDPASLLESSSGGVPTWALPLALATVVASSKWWKFSGSCFLAALAGHGATHPGTVSVLLEHIRRSSQLPFTSFVADLCSPSRAMKLMSVIASRLVTAALQRPYLGLALLSSAFGMTVMHRTIGRMLHIYSVAAIVISVYYSLMVVSTRVLHLSDSAQIRMYDSVSAIMAPFVCTQIVSLKSVFVKFGQYLSTRADILPETWSKALMMLQDEMPFDRPEYVERLLEIEFGKPFDEIFDEFDFEPMASASVAQVHKGVLRCDGDTEGSGIPIAVKIQHEGIEELLRGDFVAAGTIVEIVAYLNPNFELLRKLHYSWEREVVKELDFRNEANNLRTVRRHLQDAGLVAPDMFADDELVQDGSDSSEGLIGGREEDQVLVPRVLPGYVGQRAFCMTYIESFKITDVEILDLYGVNRTELMKRVVQSYAYQLYNAGFFNADPHAGNILVAIDKKNNVAKPVLLDFGLTCSMDHTQRLGYCRLIHSLAQLSVSGVSDALAFVGYENTQSQLHPERDMEFFGFIMSDTGDRKSQRLKHKRFVARRKAQKQADKAIDPNVQGRNFSSLPDSLVFLFRVLSLLRGLCASLEVELAYVDLMNNYAQLALSLEHDRKSFAKKLLCDAQPDTPTTYDSLNFRITQLVRNSMVEVESEVVGIQVHCIEKGKTIVSVAGGVRGVVDPRPVTHETLFPLLDLTKVLESIGVIYAIDQGNLSVNDTVGEESSQVRVEHVLSHAKTGLEDAIPSSSTHLVLRDEKLMKEKLKNSRGVAPPIRPKDGLWSASYHTISFGHVLLNVLLHQGGIRDPVQFIRNQVVAKALSGPECKKLGISTKELVYGGLNELLMNDEHTLNIATASNSFSKMLRSMFASGGGIPSGMDGDVTSEADGGASQPNSGFTLPGRLLMDPCMVNSDSLRDKCIPSVNAFGSARGLARALDATLNQAKLISPSLVKEIGKVRSVESNAFYGGEWQWGLGFQMYKLDVAGKRDGPLMYVHHSFGGSFCFVVPSRAISFVITVNSLTLDRQLTQRIVTEVCSALKLGDASVMFQGGMF